MSAPSFGSKKDIAHDKNLMSKKRKIKQYLGLKYVMIAEFKAINIECSYLQQVLFNLEMEAQIGETS